MDNLTMLFIRACKSKNPEKRLYSVYRRFYGNYENVESSISYILSKICESHINITTTQLIDKLSPSNTWMYKNDENVETPYYIIVMRMLCSEIRYTPMNKLEDFVKPATFREIGEKSTHVQTN